MARVYPPLSSASPSGTAGGSLSGSYPNPSLAGSIAVSAASRFSGGTPMAVPVFGTMVPAMQWSAGTGGLGLLTLFDENIGDDQGPQLHFENTSGSGFGTYINTDGAIYAAESIGAGSNSISNGGVTLVATNTSITGSATFGITTPGTVTLSAPATWRTALAITAPNTPYTPAAGANWVNPDPTTVQQALDRLAAVVSVSGASPIP